MITLEMLQSYYHIPLADVAKELGLSLTMLKKICRGFGIQRWPHRQIRSINKTMQELHEKHNRAATDEAAEIHKQMVLLARKRTLVMRGASSGLQSALRNALFLTNPQDLFEGEDDPLLSDPSTLPGVSTVHGGPAVTFANPPVTAPVTPAQHAAFNGTTPPPLQQHQQQHQQQLPTPVQPQPQQQQHAPAYAMSAPVAPRPRSTMMQDAFGDHLMAAVSASERRRQRVEGNGLRQPPDAMLASTSTPPPPPHSAGFNNQPFMVPPQRPLPFGAPANFPGAAGNMFATQQQQQQQQQQQASAGVSSGAGAAAAAAAAAGVSCWPSDSCSDDHEMEDLASIDFEVPAPPPPERPPQQLPMMLQSGPGRVLMHPYPFAPPGYMLPADAAAAVSALGAMARMCDPGGGVGGVSSAGGPPLPPPELQEAFEMQQLRKVEQASEAHFRQYLMHFQQQQMYRAV